MIDAAQSLPVDIHYHHVAWIWILFFFGQFLHIALQVDDLARKSSKPRDEVLGMILIQVCFRTFWCAMIFGLIWQYPLIISNVLKIFGHPIGPDEADVMAIPMNNFIAGIYGLSLDSVLGYIPVLKSQLPPVQS
jgi:hypothetical protein